MGGNFDAAPKLFKQLCVILAPRGTATVPVVYALMTTKTQEAYEELLQAVVDECASQNMVPSPDVVITDFEKGVINAPKTVLGDDVQIRGCFFHLCQNTWSKIQQTGLVPKYKDDEEFRHFIGMLDGFAFLPLGDVPNGMAFLKTSPRRSRAFCDVLRRNVCQRDLPPCRSNPRQPTHSTYASEVSSLNVERALSHTRGRRQDE